MLKKTVISPLPRTPKIQAEQSVNNVVKRGRGRPSKHVADDQSGTRIALAQKDLKEPSPMFVESEQISLVQTEPIQKRYFHSICNVIGMK